MFLTLALGCTAQREPIPNAIRKAEADIAASAPLAPSLPAPAIPKNGNVILISIDSLRADMPWAGYPHPIAPRLTELEKKSVSFTRAYALSSYTSMSLGGLLSGKFPSETKRDGYFFGTYSKENLLFPELLQAAKIRTMAVHAHGYFKKAGFDQGFDRWEIVPNLKWNNTTDENVTSPEVEAIAEKLLANSEIENERFFAWFHFLDPHDRYMQHQGVALRGKGLRERYDGEVEYTDRYIGKLLDFIATRPWSSRTTLIVTSDHGEAFGEHKQFVHGFELWENLVKVPLFFMVPSASPKRIDVPRSAVDIAPTILELLGLGTSTEFRGTSLVQEIMGGPSNERDIVVDLPVTSDNDRRRGLIHGHHKLIAFRDDHTVQVFDLENDPAELHPLPKTNPAYIDLVSRYKTIAESVKTVPPTKCKEGCLNRAYVKK